MNQVLEILRDWLASGRLVAAFNAMVILVLGLLVTRLVSRNVGRLVTRYFGLQQGALARRISYYGLVVLVLVSVLRELGFELTVLLGAAGVLSVALGFASQTSASNLISGLFLMAEKPFVVGDIITVGGTTGEVLSVDLLSVKLRTFDNLFVRVPNETMVKAEITNLTRFPIRRLDVKVGVAYKENVDRVKEVLLEVAEKNPLCLEEPRPLILFLGFGDSSLDFQFSVWAVRQNFLELRNTIHTGIKEAFDAAGIEIPFPHRSLYAGSVTDPFPVRVVGEAPPPAPASAVPPAAPPNTMEAPPPEAV